MLFISLEVKTYFHPYKPFYVLCSELLLPVSLVSCLVWSIPEYQSSYACTELSRYLNVRCMAFVACVIRPGKISLICKLHFVNRWLYYSYTHFHIDKVVIDGQVSMLFLMADFLVSIIPSHVWLIIVLSIV